MIQLKDMSNGKYYKDKGQQFLKAKSNTNKK